MKKIFRAVSVFLAFTFTVTAFPMHFTVAGESDENLIVNSSFADVVTDENGEITSLEGWGLAKADSNNSFTLTENSDGFNTLKIISTNDTVTPDAVTKKDIVLDKDKYYKISVQVNIEDNDGDFYSAWGGVYITYRYNNSEVYTSEKLRSKTNGWKTLSFIIHGGEIPDSAWNRQFCMRVAGTRAVVSFRCPSITVYSGEVGESIDTIETQSIIKNGDFSVFDNEADDFSNRFSGFAVAGKGSACLLQEQVFETVNGIENTPAAKLTYKKNSTPRDALFTATSGSFDTSKSYRLSAWIKLTPADVYDEISGEWVDSDAFDNNYSEGYVKLHFDVNNNYSGKWNYQSAPINVCGDWQYVSVLVDRSLYEGVSVWQTARAGIVVYNMTCNVYIADLRLEEFVGGVVKNDAEHGTLVVNRTNARAGDEVYVTAKAENGCQLLDNSLRYTYLDKNGNTVSEVISAQKRPVYTEKTVNGYTGRIYTEIGTLDNDVYYFIMPEHADVTVSAVFCKTPQFMDANVDGSVNILDLIRIKKYFANVKPMIALGVCDTNSDGSVNAFDLVVFVKLLLNPDAASEFLNYDLELWVTNALDRVLKGDESNGVHTAELYGAKGEYESFQIVADSNAQNTTLTAIKFTDLKDNKGNVLSAEKYITVYREHYVTVSVSSPSSSGVKKDQIGEIPDALIPLKSPVQGVELSNDARFKALPYTLDGAACQPFFVDVEIPRDAASGRYTASFEIHTNSGVQGGELILDVWDIELSETQTQGSWFGTRSTVTNLKREEAAKNRIFISLSDAQQQKEFNSKYGYNNSNIGFWSGVDIDNPDKQMATAPTVDKVTSVASKHYDGLNLFAYTADEISDRTDLYPSIIKYAQALHKAGVKQLITMPPVAELLDDGLGENRAAVDIWVMLPKQFDASSELIAQARMKKDTEIWTYNCLAQDDYSPKMLLDYPLINFRIHTGFINYAVDADGFLYWAVDNYGSLADPWTSLNESGSSTVFNGDGKLFYPSEDIGIEGSYVPSLRVKAIRDGFEDYELCAALEELNGEKTDVSAIASSFGLWTQNSEALLNNREFLGKLIP